MAGNVIAGVGGAAAGAVVAGAVVAARYEIKEARERSKQAKIQQRMDVIRALFTEHLANHCDPNVIEQARRTDLELHTISPAFPQLKLAFDAVLSYQRNRSNRTMFKSLSLFRQRREYEADPKTIVCEILKAWMQAKCEDVDIHIAELEAYRNFARGFLLHDCFMNGMFVDMICHFVRHLGALVDCVLRQKQDCTRHIKALRKEAYNFVLHAVKLMLLGPTTFEVPTAMYSTDSLGWLRKTVIQKLAYASDFDEYLAAELRPQWATTSGRLLKGLLCCDHGTSFCNLMEGTHPERGARPIQVAVRAAQHLPRFTEFDISGVDPFVKVSVHYSDAGVQRVFSEACTKVIYDVEHPVWDETLEVSVLANPSCFLRVEVMDWNLISLGMVQNPACAMVRDIPASEVIEQAGSGKQRWLPLRTIDSESKPLGNARLLLGFAHPSVEAEVQAAQQRWERGGFDPQRDGLVSEDFCMCFLHAVQETDSLVYFLDILFAECLEIAQSLGNLGMVMCAHLMRPLLDEIEMRLLTVEKVINTELLELVYNNMVSKKLSESSWSRMFGVGDREVNPQIVESCRKLQAIKSLMLSDLADLRYLCSDRYSSCHDVMAEAQASIDSLMSRIGGADSTKRSGRFAIASVKMPSLAKSLPAPEMPALEDAPVKAKAKTQAETKRKEHRPKTAPSRMASTGLPCCSSKTQEGDEKEELRVNPSDGQPATFTDLRFLHEGASEAELAEWWAAMRPVAGSGSCSCSTTDAGGSTTGGSSCDEGRDGPRPRAGGGGGEGVPPESELSSLPDDSGSKGGDLASSTCSPPEASAGKGLLFGRARTRRGTASTR